MDDQGVNNSIGLTGRKVTIFRGELYKNLRVRGKDQDSFEGTGRVSPRWGNFFSANSWERSDQIFLRTIAPFSIFLRMLIFF